MKRSRFSEEQIGVLKEAEAGPMKDLCRRIGISDATLYHWKAKYGGLEVSETRRLRQLEEENGRRPDTLTHSISSFPEEFKTAIEIVSL